MLERLGGMAKDFRAVDRDQPMLLPPDLRSWLPQRHLALFVLEVVERLDLSAVRKSYRLGGVGREAYDPAVMTALLIYAMCQGQRSSRVIEAECRTDVAFRVITAQQFPDHTTISRFRAKHRAALAELFGQVLSLCHAAGMGQVGTVAVDSVKIGANASSRKNYTAERYRAMAGQHDAQHAAQEHAAQEQAAQEQAAQEQAAKQQARFRAMAEAMLDEADEVDAAEDEQYGEGNSGDELPPEFAPGPDRGRRIQERLDKLAADGAAEQAEAVAEDVSRAQTRLTQAETTEAKVRGKALGRHQARASRGNRRPVEEHKTVQEAAAATAAARARLEGARAGAGPAATRQAQRPSAASRTCNFTDPDSRIMPLPNRGWLQGFNAQLAVSGDHLIIATGISTAPNDQAAFVPMMEAAVAMTAKHLPGKDIGIFLADAGYCSETALTAPGPDRLIAPGRDLDKTKDKQIRRPARAAMAKRLSAGSTGRETYKRRGATVEPVIGHLKDRIGFTRFSSRGEQAAENELAFAATCLNIRRLFTTTPRLATS